MKCFQLPSPTFDETTKEWTFKRNKSSFRINLTVLIFPSDWSSIWEVFISSDSFSDALLVTVGSSRLHQTRELLGPLLQKWKSWLSENYLTWKEQTIENIEAIQSFHKGGEITSQPMWQSPHEDWLNVKRYNFKAEEKKCMFVTSG